MLVGVLVYGGESSWLCGFICCGLWFVLWFELLLRCLCLMDGLASAVLRLCLRSWRWPATSVDCLL